MSFKMAVSKLDPVMLCLSRRAGVFVASASSSTKKNTVAKKKVQRERERERGSIGCNG
jgi:hypothetical protein